MTRPAPRIARSVPIGKRRPNDRLRPRHREFIRRLPCLACGKPAPSECAHVRSSGDGGTGIDDAMVELLAIKLYEHDHQGKWPVQPGWGGPSWMALNEEDREMYRELARGERDLP